MVKNREGAKANPDFLCILNGFGQEELGGARRARRSQWEPGGAKRSQEKPGGTKRSQKELGGAGSSQEEPGAARVFWFLLGCLGPWGGPGNVRKYRKWHSRTTFGFWRGSLEILGAPRGSQGLPRSHDLFTRKMKKYREGVC